MRSGSFSLTTAVQMQLIDISRQLEQVLHENQLDNGLLYLMNPHTTAGLTVNEGADPAVRTDIIDGLRQIVPLHGPYRHAEGNSPAHIMATLTGCSLQLPVARGQVQLGTWQKVFFCEFDGPRQRRVLWRFLAD